MHAAFCLNKKFGLIKDLGHAVVFIWHRHVKDFIVVRDGSHVVEKSIAVKELYFLSHTSGCHARFVQTTDLIDDHRFSRNIRKCFSFKAFGYANKHILKFAVIDDHFI
ncbi:hypothetical protein D3C86_1598680 [compost metagenome]